MKGFETRHLRIDVDYYIPEESRPAMKGFETYAPPAETVMRKSRGIPPRYEGV